MPLAFRVLINCRPRRYRSWTIERITMTNPITAGVHRASNWSMAISVLMIVAGVLAIVAPLMAGIAVTAVVSWLLIFSGVLHLSLAWRGDHASAIVWEILIGVLYGAIGFYVLMNPVTGLAGLTVAVAVYLLLEGVLEFVLSFQLRSARGSGWLLVDGMVTLVLAVMIWSTWPSSAAWAIGTLVGISMLFSGITRLMFSQAARRMLV
jgi:uncharacterized membrane protein HdeD (DUF308 family)